jgi:predicted transcriptional regulator
MKPFHGIFIIMWLTGAFMPQFAFAESELDAAAKITGVTLAEHRRLDSSEEIKKSDGSQNNFLAAAKRHQLEFAELLGLAQAIKQQLNSANAYEAPKQRKEEVNELLKKNAALQIQATRYVRALEKSRSLLLSGYRPVSKMPQDWEGRMCNDKQECIRLDPITALFTIATARAGQ